MLGRSIRINDKDGVIVCLARVIATYQSEAAGVKLDGGLLMTKPETDGANLGHDVLAVNLGHDVLAVKMPIMLPRQLIPWWHMSIVVTVDAYCILLYLDKTETVRQKRSKIERGSQKYLYI